MAISRPFWAAQRLAAFIREQAAWRLAQARRFPNDRYNAPAAEALEDLARYVEGLPHTDRRLVQLVEYDCFDEEQTYHAGPAARRLFMRYGYGAEAEPRELLEDLVVASGQDRRREGGGWSVGAGSWRFDYPPGFVAVDRGELLDVVSIVAAQAGPPTFTMTRSGQPDIAIPHDFEQRTVRVRVRTRDARHDQRWVALADLDEAPRLERDPSPNAVAERWPASARDGTDTYRRGRGPLEPGVVERFELPRRDILRGGRILGEYYTVEGRPDLRDVVVALEDHPVDGLSFVRLVRCVTPKERITATEARALAFRAYRERCRSLGRSESGWVNEIPPRYWSAASPQVLMSAIADDPHDQDAREQLLELGYFESSPGVWSKDLPETSIPGRTAGRVPTVHVPRQGGDR